MDSILGTLCLVSDHLEVIMYALMATSALCAIKILFQDGPRLRGVF
jgi:hypothetical protein